jgi:hypothetical protein
MSRKDYIKVAAILREIPNPTSEDWNPATLKVDLVERFADMFAEDNSRFNYYKFKDATERR